jgi:hypothetical protein
MLGLTTHLVKTSIQQSVLDQVPAERQPIHSTTQSSIPIILYPLGAYHIWGITPGVQNAPSLQSPNMGRTYPLGAYHIWGITPGVQNAPSLQSPNMGRTYPLGAYHIWGITPGAENAPSLQSPNMGRTYPLLIKSLLPIQCTRVYVANVG